MACGDQEDRFYLHCKYIRAYKLFDILKNVDPETYHKNIPKSVMTDAASRMVTEIAKHNPSLLSKKIAANWVKNKRFGAFTNTTHFMLPSSVMAELFPKMKRDPAFPDGVYDHRTAEEEEGGEDDTEDEEDEEDDDTEKKKDDEEEGKEDEDDEEEEDDEEDEEQHEDDANPKPSRAVKDVILECQNSIQKKGRAINNEIRKLLDNVAVMIKDRTEAMQQELAARDEETTQQLKQQLAGKDAEIKKLKQRLDEKEQILSVITQAMNRLP